MQTFPRSRAGFTLLEVMLACILMAVAVLGLMALIPTTAQMTETTEEGNLSMQACHQMSEAIRQYADKDFAYVWRVYNSVSSDDPNGIGTAPGAAFSIEGLLNATGTSDVGSITFYTDETAVVDEVGLPKDLNGDGDANDTDVSGDFELLPYRMSVSWKDQRGLLRSQDFFSQVADY